MHNPIPYYPLVVLGATFAGLGAAYSRIDETLVLERSALVGYEYINSYRPGDGWHETKLSERGEDLKAELVRRQILGEDGRVHIPAVAPVMYNRITHDKLQLQFHTEVTAIDEHEQGWEITIYSPSGFSRMLAGAILDTRPEHAPEGAITGKRLGAMLNCGTDEPELPGEEQLGVQFVRGKLAGEVMAQLRIDTGDDWPSARHKLHELWTNRPEAWQAWTLSAVAGYFNYEGRPKVPTWTERRADLLSYAYPNPLAALEAGIRTGRELTI
ncbi:hypothetical protein [Paenibacillus daejeonensis]|uniref:hypothetical protein n=1 Tax=Paenibacillus daejeonensis TaxID=135193 RepID=UPI00037A64B4|nr:hypothetical protein [Paenibacillus daejeonensis]